MAQGPDGKTIIIVKKVVGHGGHHGGAWKVAYADFVTAMMALFLVLWLVNSASVVTREKIASYFKRPGVFEAGSGTPLQIGGAGILTDTFAPPADGNSQTQAQTPKDIYVSETDGGLKKSGFSGGMLEEKVDGAVKDGKGKGGDEIGEGGKPGDGKNLEQIASELKTALGEDKSVVSGFMGQIAVKLDQRGLHLEIMDTAQASMFQVGSSQIRPEAEKELLKIADILKKLPNPVDIEGHTDATPFSPRSAAHYDNWNLSTDRANAARRVLQAAGIQDWQIARVVGYAAQRLKTPETPLNPGNRRISVSMRYTDVAKDALVGKPVSESQLKKPGEKLPSPTAPTSAPLVGSAASSNAQEHSDATAEHIQATQVDEKILEQNAQRKTDGGLQVEINTTLPEGMTITGENPAAPDAPKPTWREKDKIFGDENPFFTK